MLFAGDFKSIDSLMPFLFHFGIFYHRLLFVADEIYHAIKKLYLCTVIHLEPTMILAGSPAPLVE